MEAGVRASPPRQRDRQLSPAPGGAFPHSCAHRDAPGLRPEARLRLDDLAFDRFVPAAELLLADLAKRQIQLVGCFELFARAHAKIPEAARAREQLLLERSD